MELPISDSVHYQIFISCATQQLFKMCAMSRRQPLSTYFCSINSDCHFTKNTIITSDSVHYKILCKTSYN